MKRFFCWMLLVTLCLGAISVRAEQEGYFTVLLIGADDAAQRDVQAGEVQHYGRADAILIAQLDLTRHKAQVLSIDRDYLIELPDQGVTKLCIAHYFGGPEALVAQVNQLFSLDIHYYAMIEREDMGRLVDKLGGITVDVRKEDLKPTGLRKAGKQKLRGKQAVAYMGKRNIDDLTSDVARNERQRIVLETIMEVLLAQPMTKLTKTVQALLPLVQTNIGAMDILALLPQSAALDDMAGIEQDRTPLPEDRLVRFENMHSVVYVANMEQEIERVRAFLYHE